MLAIPCCARSTSLGRKWTVAETETFYRGLRAFGLDFDMISRILLKDRSHLMIKVTLCLILIIFFDLFGGLVGAEGRLTCRPGTPTLGRGPNV